MELLIGAFVSLTVQWYKKIQEKFGQENTRIMTLAIGLLLSAVWTLLYKELGIITEQHIQAVMRVWVYSIAIFEVIIKNAMLLLNKKK